MKLYTKKEILPLILIFFISLLGFYFYPQLPEKIATHWNINNQADGWSSKNFAVFFFPALTLVLYLLLSFIPLLDPLKKNIETFATPYFWLKTFFVLFFGLMYFLTLFTGLGHQVNVGRFVILGIAVLFFLIGLILPKVKRNYTIGIRLPWTIHSEAVWDKTHQLGGKIFVGSAVLMALCSFFSGKTAFLVFLTVIFLSLISLALYSYLEFRKIEKDYDSRSRV